METNIASYGVYLTQLVPLAHNIPALYLAKKFTHWQVLIGKPYTWLYVVHMCACIGYKYVERLESLVFSTGENCLDQVWWIFLFVSVVSIRLILALLSIWTSDTFIESWNKSS